MTVAQPNRPLSLIFEAMLRHRTRQGWTAEMIHTAYPSHSLEKIRALQDQLRSTQ